MRRAVFLDRDGVINLAYIRNGKSYPPKDLSQLVILTGVEESVKKLRKFGFEVVVVTNQPDISNGNSSYEMVHKLHKEIQLLTGIKNYYICPHVEVDRCSCRKPMPGLLLEAAKDLNLDLKKSYMVGDRWRDVSAGQSAGCKNFFIDYNYREERPKEPFITVLSLLHAVEIIIGENNDN
jgi:D-glycero-D-manno-heptose 1,7-bisphosphate phosphatase